MYVNTVDTNDIHISAQIIYMLTLLTQGISISNAFTAMYANTVDTNDIHICAHNFLNI